MRTERKDIIKSIQRLKLEYSSIIKTKEES